MHLWTICRGLEDEIKTGKAKIFIIIIIITYNKQNICSNQNKSTKYSKNQSISSTRIIHGNYFGIK